METSSFVLGINVATFAITNHEHEHAFLIPNILQQPFRRNFPAQPFRLGQLIHLAGNGKELRALDIAALGVSDLLI
jgi:hypothetical protein